VTTTVHVLGSGTPTPTPDRFGTAFAVEITADVSGEAHEELLMVDCGPAATWKLAKVGRNPADVGTLFFTHHHFDHNVDYPCFLLTRWDQSAGTTGPLHALGPTGTVDLTERLVGVQGAFALDIDARINFPGSAAIWAWRGGELPRPRPKVEATDIAAGYVHETPLWSMRAGQAQHVQPWLDCLSYRLETAEGSIVFTGDTEPCDSVRDLALGADVMFAMCWNTSENQPNHTEGLCTLEAAVQLAADADVRSLVLVHCGEHVASPGVADAALAGLRDTYKGRVVLAEELQRIELRDHELVLS